MGSWAVTALQRTVVIGSTGSGKTTFARKLGGKLGLSVVELDALNWEANWQPADPEIFRARVTTATKPDHWVVEGGYHAVRDIVWGHATDIVWLDYAFPLVAYQLMRRTLSRIITQEEMWSGNKESFYMTFFHKDSILLWLLQTYWRNRREYPRLFQLAEYKHLIVTRLRTRRAAQRWLDDQSSG